MGQCTEGSSRRKNVLRSHPAIAEKREGRAIEIGNAQLWIIDPNIAVKNDRASVLCEGNPAAECTGERIVEGLVQGAIGVHTDRAKVPKAIRITHPSDDDSSIELERDTVAVIGTITHCDEYLAIGIEICVQRTIGVQSDQCKVVIATGLIEEIPRHKDSTIGLQGCA